MSTNIIDTLTKPLHPAPVVPQNAPDDDDMPSGNLTIIPDFLPPPGKLVFKVPREKITVELFKPTLDYFKVESEKLGVPYVHLIRAVLGAYVERMQADHPGSPPARG